ncbi:beta-glucosidase family protein [Luteibacter sp. UNCMF366Tsu5.1]|uniref:beta-glucosidase family protein n=1 Tax=Luteibacter sp. UNCMF366Tsu5.1 TaxID=1502758 RepID=UPI000908D65C|nr:glycoside hydrolase family 3 C-terminal domain-containing protein [Luteibacter sp. UNCMF366Tsu5.1]SFW29459.1 beta-glucosidase [Luteibacter sp. UNCMF366Tsu5.1]
MKKLNLAACLTAALTSTVAAPVSAQQTRGAAPALHPAQRSLQGIPAVRGHAPDFLQDWLADQIADRIVRKMTLQEKLDYIGGTGAWDIKPLTRLGLPQIYATDASLGVRLSSPAGVSYPAGQALASSWDTHLAKQFGSSIGRDARQLGFQNILGPGVNMYRTPYAGRAFEYMSGEDPYLGAALVPQVIDGIQDQGVWATLKHLVANDEENNRLAVNISVDERTLRELYLVPFESAVKAGKPANIMCAFNGVNGPLACENAHLNNEIVKQQWGFKGFIESDYNALQDGTKGALGGTDLDMPNGQFMNATTLQPLIANGTIPQSVIDDKVRRIVRQIALFGFTDNTVSTDNTQTPEQRAQSQAMARDIAREGTVLLKNDHNNLPLASDHPLKVAVIGYRSVTAPPSGFGSANINPNEYVNDIDGIRAAAPQGSQVDYIDRMSLDPGLTPSVGGFTGAYSSNGQTVTRDDRLINLDWNNGGSPFGSAMPDAAVWSGKITPTTTGDHVFKVRADGAVRVQINGQEIVNNGAGTVITPSIPPTIPSYGTIRLQAGQTYDVSIQYERKPNYFGTLGGFQGVQFSWASLVPTTDLGQYDAVVVVGGLGSEYEGEGFDRPFILPEAQDELIANVAAANPRTTVVMHAGGGVSMRAWVDKVASVLYPWYAGEEGGAAIGEILFGKVNPSGKLPITIERDEKDNPTYANYPFPQNSTANKEIVYSEGLLNGYRGFEAKGITPEFAFGHGLSYSSFTYGAVHVTFGNVPYLDDRQIVARAQFTITNTSQREGTEVAQVYVGEDAPPVSRPKKELKGFARVTLKPGETRQVAVPLNARAFAWFDTSVNTWRIDRGSYTVSVGGASDAIAGTASITLPRDQLLSVKDSLPVVESTRRNER